MPTNRLLIPIRSRGNHRYRQFAPVLLPCPPPNPFTIDSGTVPSAEGRDTPYEYTQTPRLPQELLTRISDLAADLNPGSNQIIPLTDVCWYRRTVLLSYPTM